MENEYRWNAKLQLGTGSAKPQLGNEGPERHKPSWGLAFPVE